MAYTISSLATYKPLTKQHYYTSRFSILGIIPHVVVGKPSGQGCYDYFNGNVQASCNYFIEDNGKIWCFVHEKYGAWTTSNYNVDMNHVTVEIASGTTEPYAISDAAYKALVKLTVDVYKRNGLTKCMWASDKRYDGTPGGVPMHRNYKLKSCPGNHIVNTYYKTGKFCKDVNAGLEGKSMSGQPKSSAKNNYGIKYTAHSETYGWNPEVRDGQIAGTVGEGKRLEAFKLNLPEGVSCSVKCHIQNIGWKTYKDITKDTVIGTTGKGYRMEAFEICNVKGIEEGKKLRYAAHIQNIGWTESYQGYPIGTMGQSLRIEAVKFWVE